MMCNPQPASSKKAECPKESSNHDDDEQIARDIQLALQLEAEEEHQLQLRLKSQRQRQQSTSRRRHSLHLKEDDDFESYNSSSTSSSSASRITSNANSMLYLPCEIAGGIRETLLVDSGASSSAMSLATLRRLGLQKQLNTNISGRARGVGSANLLGIVEHVELRMGGHVEFRLFFLVLESDTPFLIFGLDQMRRFRCLIDLDANALRFGGLDGVSVPFLDADQAAAAAARTFLGNHKDCGENNPKDSNQQLSSTPLRRTRSRRPLLGRLTGGHR